MATFALAKKDFAGEGDFMFVEGEKVKLTKFAEGDETWEGETEDGKTGSFPASYVELIKSEESKPAPSSGGSSAGGDDLEGEMLNLMDSDGEDVKKSSVLPLMDKLLDRIKKFGEKEKLLKSEIDDQRQLAQKLGEELERVKGELANNNNNNSPNEAADAELTKENEALKKKVASLEAEVESLKHKAATVHHHEVKGLPEQHNNKPKPTAASEQPKPTASEQPKPQPSSTESHSSGGVKANPFLAKDPKAAKKVAASQESKPPATTSSEPASSLAPPSSGGNRSTSSRAIGVGKLRVNPECAKAYLETRNDKNPNNYALFRYNDAGNEIYVAQKGSGGLEELASTLQPDERAYAYVRVIAGDEKSKRAKFVFVSWCGTSVPMLKRARMSADKMEMKQVVKEVTVDLYATTSEELSPAVVLPIVIKAGGANYGVGTRDN